jgi:hypothetical protein
MVVKMLLLLRFVTMTLAVAYVCPDTQALTQLSIGISRLSVARSLMQRRGVPQAEVDAFAAKQMEEGLSLTKCRIEHQPDETPT